MPNQSKFNPATQAFVRRDYHLPSTGSERDRVRYVSLKGSQASKETYRQILDQVSPPLPSHGGVVLEPVTITTPSGTKFFPLACNGDVSGWIMQIEMGAKILGHLTAHLGQDSFIVSNGEVHPISSCKVEFER